MQCSELPARKKPCCCSLAYRSRENSIFQLFVIITEREHSISFLPMDSIMDDQFSEARNIVFFTPPTFGMAVVIYDVFCLSTFPCFE